MFFVLVISMQEYNEDYREFGPSLMFYIFCSNSSGLLWPWTSHDLVVNKPSKLKLSLATAYYVQQDLLRYQLKPEL